jgi:hypothetical protein
LAINIWLRNPNIIKKKRKEKKRRENKTKYLSLDKVLHGQRLKGFDLIKNEFGIS